MKREEGSKLQFSKITHDDMDVIWNYLQKEHGKTTDFSYGGLFMWIDSFKYEFAIENDTLFIKGVVENDKSKPAFSLPIGPHPLSESLDLLKDYCKNHNIPLELSAVPEYALEDISGCNITSIEELKDWGDYLYEIESLASLQGKKMSKKRNHVHHFLANYTDWHFDALTPENANDAMAFMDLSDREGDMAESAIEERKLTRQLLKEIINGDTHLEGGILYVNGNVAAFTIGDIKHDTLFVHVEKATRHITGSYEMINNLFAKLMAEKYPFLKYINREDDAGDPGLRKAKESYHPCNILRKYNVII